MATPAELPVPAEAIDRRARRRLETLEEILDIAEALLREEGVNGLSLSEVARRLGVQPPSLYKYFPSQMAVYDALFERGQRANTDAVLKAIAAAPPGLPAVIAGLEASGRWALANQALAQLLFWRPLANFEPTAHAMEPGLEEFAELRRALADAVRLGQLGPGADSAEALHVAITLIAGAIVTAASNEPHLPWGEGRFSPLFPRLMALLPALYPPAQARRSRTASTGSGSVK
ncbi:MAG TPA: TetR/AcrR family transcriptional regulator [Sporichthyaceae bacterium]|nr:TetR/AcrR family transcriptional regulator [Sporichthyaceae bacterium]